MVKILSIIFLSACLTIVSAGENEVGKYNIGLAAGFTTGYGLSYRQWFENGYGVQVTCWPYYDKTNDATDASVSFGATGLKVINSTRGINLFGYLSAHMHYNYSKNNIYYYPLYEPIVLEQSVSEKTILFFGGGPGVDLHSRRISFNIMAGLMYYTDLQGSFHVGPTVETAMYYSF